MATFTYDLNGNRLSKALENSTSASYTYDAANRLTNLSHSVSGSLAPFASYGYAYNSNNNRTNRVETSGTHAPVTDNYYYDAIGEVTDVTYASGRSVSYIYDPMGNRNSVADSGTTVSYAANNLNQYTMISGLGAAGYDGNGNLTTNNGWTYAYDALKRLTSASNGVTTLTLAYDARNRCVSRIVNGTAYYFTYDGWNVIEDRDAADIQLAYYVHGARVDEMLSMVTPTGASFYHEDGLGSIAQMTNGTGLVVESYMYDLYGTVAMFDGVGNSLGTSAVGNRFLFCGREWLQNLGLYDYRNRIYSPTLGRFLQADPIRERGGINFYNYVTNDPMNRTDAYGLDPNPFGYINPYSVNPVSPIDWPNNSSSPEDEINNLVLNHLGDNHETLQLPSSYLSPTGWTVRDFDKGRDAIKTACGCDGSAYVDAIQGFNTGMWAIGSVSFRLKGTVSSADGKTWSFSGTIEPLPEMIDFLPLGGRSTSATVANGFGYFEDLMGGFNTYQIRFSGPVKDDSSGNCP